MKRALGKIMSKYTGLVVLLLVSVMFGCSQASNGTSDTSEKTESAVDFKPELAIPDFTLSTVGGSLFESSTSLPKEGLLLIKYFSTDCDHCQAEAEAYLSKKDSLQNIKTVWVTGDWAQMYMVKKFAQDYQLEELNPIAIGKERENALLVHYGFSGVPFSAIYKDNQLVKEYSADIDFSELIAMNNGTYVPERQAAETGTNQ